MKIKKFESFENIFPNTTVDSLIDYYNCSNCGALWKVFNQKQMIECPICKTKNAKIIDEDNWYEKTKERLESGEIRDLEKGRKIERDNIIDISKLKNRKKRFN